jgi:hypothetical protein
MRRGVFFARLATKKPILTVNRPRTSVSERSGVLFFERFDLVFDVSKQLLGHLQPETLIGRFGLESGDFLPVEIGGGVQVTQFLRDIGWPNARLPVCCLWRCR